MKFYIGTLNGTGIKVNTFDEFVERMREFVSQAENNGDDCFDIMVENEINSDDMEMNGAIDIYGGK